MLKYTHRPRVGISLTPARVIMSPVPCCIGPPPNIWETIKVMSEETSAASSWDAYYPVKLFQLVDIRWFRRPALHRTNNTDVNNEAVRKFFPNSPQQTLADMRYGTPRLPPNFLEQRPATQKLGACLAEKQIVWYPRRPAVTPKLLAWLWLDCGRRKPSRVNAPNRISIVTPSGLYN